MTGTIKFYKDDRGYGFITPDDGSKEIFVHISSCAEDIEDLKPGQRVRYKERVSPRNDKPEAYEVAIIG